MVKDSTRAHAVRLARRALKNEKRFEMIAGGRRKFNKQGRRRMEHHLRQMERDDAKIQKLIPGTWWKEVLGLDH